MADDLSVVDASAVLAILWAARQGNALQGVHGEHQANHNRGRASATAAHLFYLHLRKTLRDKDFG